MTVKFGGKKHFGMHCERYVGVITTVLISGKWDYNSWFQLHACTEAWNLELEHKVPGLAEAGKSSMCCEEF